MTQATRRRRRRRHRYLQPKERPPTHIWAVRLATFLKPAIAALGSVQFPSPSRLQKGGLRVDEWMDGWMEGHLTAIMPARSPVLILHMFSYCAMAAAAATQP